MTHLLDPREVSERLGISTSTLAYWRTRGEGPAFVKAGKSVRYTEAALAEWIEANTATSTSR